VFRFRRALETDLDPLLRLERRCFESPWAPQAFEQELVHPQAELWLAYVEEDGEDAEPIGYVDFWVVAGEVSLLNLAVDPRLRRRGLARQLLALMEEVGRENSGEVVFLEVRRSNLPGLELYRNFGFVQVGIRKGYYSDNREDALVLSKRLD